MPTAVKRVQKTADPERKSFPSPILFISLNLPPHSASQTLTSLKFERDQIVKGQRKYFVKREKKVS